MSKSNVFSDKFARLIIIIPNKKFIRSLPMIWIIMKIYTVGGI